MKFTTQNSSYEFGLLNACIQATMNHGEISVDDAESLAFFLDLIKETLYERVIVNS